MVVVLAESGLPDSIEVIGKTGKNERLTFAEEIALTEQVRIRAELLHRKRTGFTAEENRTNRIGDRALTQLLDAHQYLIRRLVKQYQPEGLRGIDADLEHEAITAYIDAVQRFDPNKGARLSSYTYFRIRAHLQDLRDKTNQQEIALGKSYYEEVATEPPEPIDTRQHALLRAAIGLLPERQREIAVLLLNEISYQRIAERVEIGLSSARARCNRVRHKLKFLLNFRLPLLNQLVLQSQTPTEPEVSVAATVETPPVSQETPKPSIRRLLWPRPRFPKILKIGRDAIVNPNSDLAPLVLNLAKQTPSMKTQMGQIRQDPLLLERVSKLRQSPWRFLPYGLMLSISTIGTLISHSPVLGCIALALGIALSYAWSIERLGSMLGLSRRWRRLISRVGTSGISLLSAPGIAIAAHSAIAQMSVSPATGVCGDQGFLARFASSSLMGTNSPLLNEFRCSAFGLLTLSALIFLVGSCTYSLCAWAIEDFRNPALSVQLQGVVVGFIVVAALLVMF